MSNIEPNKMIIIWGFDDEAKYNRINIGDVLYLRVNRNGSKHHGIFGRGKVIEKFVDNEIYWPKEFEDGKVIYKWRIKIEVEKLKKRARG
jgi:hypothetical protein